jgi:hypothetical protein
MMDYAGREKQLEPGVINEFGTGSAETGLRRHPVPIAWPP